MSPASFETVFASAEVWIEVVDATHGKIYPRQKFGAVPFAFKVPTDGLTLGYDATGKLKVQGLGPADLPSGNPSDGQILKWKDGTGWEWGADNAGGTAGSVDSAAILALENEQIRAVSALLKIDSERKDADISQLKSESAQLKAKAEKAETDASQLKKFICTQFPSAEICSK